MQLKWMGGFIMASISRSKSRSPDFLSGLNWGRTVGSEAGRAKILAPKKEMARTVEAYQNAMAPSMPVVLLGSTTMRDEPLIVLNFGTLSTNNTPQYNYKVLGTEYQKATGRVLNRKAVLDHLSKGAVINDSNWWILRNDAFMLGAIHASKDFHICYEGMRGVSRGVPPQALIWDDSNGRFRALGRELTMLFQAGYQPVYHQYRGDRTALSFLPPRNTCTTAFAAMRGEVTTIEASKRVATEHLMKFFSSARPLIESPRRDLSPTPQIPDEMDRASPSILSTEVSTDSSRGSPSFTDSDYRASSSLSCSTSSLGDSSDQSRPSSGISRYTPSPVDSDQGEQKDDALTQS